MATVSYAECEAIVEKIRRGDIGGEEDLYRLFHRGIGYMLHGCCHPSPSDAEDLLQEVLLIVITQLRAGALEHPARLAGYIRTVARRVAIRHIAGANDSRHTRPVQEEPQWAADASAGPQRAVRTPRLEDGQPSPEQAAIRAQTQEHMARALAQLVPRDREILLRFYLHEHTEAQIKADMGLTDTQFRLYKWRAKQRFGELARKQMSQPLTASLLRRSR